MTAVHADIDALKNLHGALVRYRHAQRDVTARASDQLRMTRSRLEERASRLRAQAELAQAEYAGCRDRADPDDPVDCSGYARAAEQSAGQLEQVQLWQQRVETGAGEFSGVAGRFADLLDSGLPRLEEQLAAIIASLERARQLGVS